MGIKLGKFVRIPRLETGKKNIVRVNPLQTGMKKKVLLFFYCRDKKIIGKKLNKGCDFDCKINSISYTKEKGLGKMNVHDVKKHNAEKGDFFILRINYSSLLFCIHSYGGWFLTIVLPFIFPNFDDI